MKYDWCPYKKLGDKTIERCGGQTCAQREEAIGKPRSENSGEKKSRLCLGLRHLASRTTGRYTHELSKDSLTWRRSCSATNFSLFFSWVKWRQENTGGLCLGLSILSIHPCRNGIEPNLFLALLARALFCNPRKSALNRYFQRNSNSTLSIINVG